MNTIITPSCLHGVIQAPPSKSQSHRALICAAQARGLSRIENLSMCDDVMATLGGLRAMGAHIELLGQEATVLPAHFTAAPRIDCGESASTLRFLMPLSLARCGGGEFILRGSLAGRPIDIYEKLFKKRRIAWKKRRDGSIRIDGHLPAGGYSLPGNVSSQFVSGLMMALPSAGRDWRIRIEGLLESRPYADMTQDIMRRFGVQVVSAGNEYISFPQVFRPSALRVSGDWSLGAFYLAAASLGADISVCGLDIDSAQGDSAVLNALVASGQAWQQSEHGLCVTGDAHPFEFDVSQCPDLALPLALVMLRRGGRLSGCRRLAFKESNRIQTLVALVGGLGGKAEEIDGDIVIAAHDSLPGGTVHSRGDHRVAMAAAIASVICTGPVTVSGAQAVSKSYPGFWGDFQSLGGIIDEQ